MRTREHENTRCNVVIRRRTQRTGDWEQRYLLNPTDHEYFFRILSQWNAWISNPESPDLDRIYRILPQSGFSGFEFFFFKICPKEQKIHFSILNADLDFDQGTLPYFLKKGTNRL